MVLEAAWARVDIPPAGNPYTRAGTRGNLFAQKPPDWGSALCRFGPGRNWAFHQGLEEVAATPAQPILDSCKANIGRDAYLDG